MSSADVRLTEDELNALEGAVMSLDISVQQVVEAIVSTRLARAESERDNAQRVATLYQRQVKSEQRDSLRLRADLEAAEREREGWRESAADLGQRLSKAEYDRDEEQYENQRLRAGIEASAVECLSIAASAARSQGEPDSDIADATLRSLSRRAKVVRDHLRALLAEDGA
jgi:chromosome segregation ATPase